jgi:ankyrin repeat protein
MAKYLLDLPEAAADVHVQSSTSKKSPLHYAVPFESVVQLLLQRGADVHARDERGEQPLWHAHTLPVVKLLLAAGADATAVDGARGSSVLHSQAKCGTCAGVICMLLKAGADPTATVVCAETVVSPAHLAGINGHFALEALLSRAADDYR